MSMSCNGKILREGPVWHCADCGHASTAWDTQHEPLMSRVENFLTCLLALVQEAVEQEPVVAEALA